MTGLGKRFASELDQRTVSCHCRWKHFLRHPVLIIEAVSQGGIERLCQVVVHRRYLVVVELRLAIREVEIVG